MIISDTHLHTSFSSDSTAPMEDMIKKALSLGLKTICFTEHYDPDFPVLDNGMDFSLDFDAYYDSWKELSEKYVNQIEVLHGIELGVQPYLKTELNEFYKNYGSRYDFIINSCHLVNRMDPYEKEYFELYGPKEGLLKYFEEVYQNLQCFEHYQTVGHLDYAARYMPHPRPEFSYASYKEILDAILSYIIKKDKALEVNTSGLKAGLPWPNPHMDILKRYQQLGGKKITIGSDAHRPEHMAYDFVKLPGILKEAGFDHYELYRKRKEYLIPL